MQSSELTFSTLSPRPPVEAESNAEGGRNLSDLANVSVECRRTLLGAFAPQILVVVSDHLRRLQRENVILRDEDGLTARAGCIDIDRLLNPCNFRREDGLLFRLATAQQRHGCAHAHSR